MCKYTNGKRTMADGGVIRQPPITDITDTNTNIQKYKYGNMKI